jgi:hypothetical protein
MPALTRKLPLVTCTIAAWFATTNTGLALDITGVGAYSIGLPEVNVVLRENADAAPYDGFDDIGDPLTNLRMFFDTGTSGVILYEGASEKLEIPLAQLGGNPVVFEDVGVGGSTTFNVSEPLHMSLGGFVQDPPDDYDPATADTVYPRQYADMRLAVGPPGSGLGLLAPFSQMGIVGTPAMEGMVSVINPKPGEQFGGTIETRVYDPLLSPIGIPSVDVQIQLSYKSFDRFTETTPDAALDPTLRENPFIGPDPLAVLEQQDPLPDSPPGITVSLGDMSATGSFLLDTGNMSTSISRAMADSLNVRYVEGTEGTTSPVLEIFDPSDRGADGTPIPDQFVGTFGGIGTQQPTIAGFYLDSLLIRTQEGDPVVNTDPRHLNFLGAPVFVQDIELRDPDTQEVFTFQGILGMNYLAGSFADPLNFLLTGLFQPGAFDALVLDQPNSLLGLSFAAVAIPLPASLPMLVPALTMLMLSLRHRRAH